MKLDYLYEVLLFVALIVLQVLVFNQISVFGFARSEERRVRERV